MSRHKVKSDNLFHSLGIIFSDNLLKDLISHLAPDFKYDWLKTYNNPPKRTPLLYSELKEFQNNHPSQHSELATYLSTIALVNSTDSGKYILNQIKRIKFLNELLESYDFDVTDNAYCTSHLAAWLILQTFELPKGSTQLERAQQIWEDVITTSTKNNAKFQSFLIHEPTIRTEEDQDKKVNTKFIEYLRLLLLDRQSNPNRPIPIGYVRQRHDNCFQYFFTVPKFLHLTSQLSEEEDGYKIGRDRNSTSIEIQFYPNINIVKVSDESGINIQQIAIHFIEDVLGTSIDNSLKNKVFTHILEKFKSSSYLPSLRSNLTDAAIKAKANVWIEEMDFSYGEVLIDKENEQLTFKEIDPAELSQKEVQTFPPMRVHSCGEKDDVYKILNRSFREEFSEEHRTIHRIKLIVKLRNDFTISDGKTKIPKKEFEEYPITIRDTARKLSYPPNTPAKHRDIIEELLRKWEFIGIPKASVLFRRGK